MESPLKHNTKSLEDQAKEIFAFKMGWDKYYDGPVMTNSKDCIEAMKDHASSLTQQVEELTRENSELKEKLKNAEESLKIFTP